MSAFLYEIPRTRQVPGEPPRRWFTSDALDLVVWFADDSSGPANDAAILGFQLCYDKLHAERALTWMADGGQLVHKAVDDGESAGQGHKASPVLVPDGVPAAGKLLADFRLAAVELPPEIRALVIRELEKSARAGVKPAH